MKHVRTQHAIGDAVIALRDCWQDASEDLPEQDLCRAGDVLEVRKLGKNMCWPVYVAHPHREAGTMFGVQLSEIRPA